MTAALPTTLDLPCPGGVLRCTSWGREDAEVVLACHGPAGTARHFDAIAAHLAQRWRVLCPELPGLGHAQGGPVPAAERLASHVQQAAALLDALGTAHCRWLGSGLGAAIGLQAAAGPLRGRIGRLVLNDFRPAPARPPGRQAHTGWQWAAWDALSIPVLVLRGEHCPHLPAALADILRNRGPRAVVATIPGCASAPALDTPAQWSLVERFFAG